MLNEELFNNLLKTSAKIVIYSHTTIMFEDDDILLDEAIKIRDILYDYVFDHKDEEKASYLIFSVANKIALRKGLEPLVYSELTEKADEKFKDMFIGY